MDELPGTGDRLGNQGIPVSDLTRDEMMELILVFPNPENGKKIKRILKQSGFLIRADCTAGAQALLHAQELDEGIVICGFGFSDMTIRQLREYLPERFEMLLLASAEVCGSLAGEGIVCLPMPFRVHELIQAVHMMADTASRRGRRQKVRRVRTKEEEAVIADAKAFLQERNYMTEEEAHRYLQKRSMDNGMSLLETAQMIFQEE